MTTAPRVLYLVAKPDASAWWRVERPIARLAASGYPCTRADIDEMALEYDGLAHGWDAVVMTRLYWPDHEYGERLVGSLKRQGLTVLYEVDDDWYSDGVSERLVEALPNHPEVGTVADQERAREDRIFALRLMDGVIASSEPLAEVCRSLTEAPVTVVPNAIDADWWIERLQGHERLVPGLTVGWLGGPRLEEDLNPVAVAWGRIADRYPDVQFVVTGDRPGGVARYVPPERVWPIPWQRLDALPRAMANIDIACVAVADNRWNRCKTPIKAWEAALSGAAVVASPTLYGDCTWLAAAPASTVDHWEHDLAYLIDHPAARERRHASLAEHVRENHSLQTQMRRWPEAWAHLIEAAQGALV